MSSLTERMIGAAKLDAAIYEEVEADTTATGQALLVVVLSSVAAGLGFVTINGIRGVIWGTLSAIVGWIIWAGITYLVGTKMLPEPQTQSDMGELLRTIGFAMSPGILRVLGIIPVVGLLVNVIVFFWLLAAVVVAVRQALDYKSTGRAIGVCLIGFIVYILVAFLFGTMSAGISGLMN
ncbi:MAG: YIP1 family protein [Thermoanaerobaculia bacterium]